MQLNAHVHMGQDSHVEAVANCMCVIFFVQRVIYKKRKITSRDLYDVWEVHALITCEIESWKKYVYVRTHLHMHDTTWFIRKHTKAKALTKRARTKRKAKNRNKCDERATLQL